MFQHNNTVCHLVVSEGTENNVGEPVTSVYSCEGWSPITVSGVPWPMQMPLGTCLAG